VFEQLEHVEKPDELISKLSFLLKDDGRIFLTTAIYAAAVDHIHLFHNVADVRNSVKGNFKIDSELSLPVSLQDYDEGMNNVSINYACLLSR